MKDHPIRCGAGFAPAARRQIGRGFGTISMSSTNTQRAFASSAMWARLQRDWSSVSEAVHGTKGTSDPHSVIRPNGGQMWRFRESQPIDPYVQEHMDLINAIHNDTALNEAKQVTDSTLTAIMGREAPTAAQAWKGRRSELQFAYAPRQLCQDCSKMKFGDFRTLPTPDAKHAQHSEGPSRGAAKGISQP